MRLALFLSLAIWWAIIETVRAEDYRTEALRTLQAVCRSDAYYPREERLCPTPRELARIITKIINGTWQGFKGCKVGEKR